MTSEIDFALTPPVRKSTGASMARHRSEQDVATPPDFMLAVVRRFGPIAHDLAALPENTKAPSFYSPAEDSLKQDWTTLEGNLWLNPPFGTIRPWAAKCRASTSQRHRFHRLLMLVPASVGSRWFDMHVHQHSLVLGLLRRVKFVGAAHGYPKDLILVVYGGFRGFDTWDWLVTSPTIPEVTP